MVVYTGSLIEQRTVDPALVRHFGSPNVMNAIRLALKRLESQFGSEVALVLGEADHFKRYCISYRAYLG